MHQKYYQHAEKIFTTAVESVVPKQLLHKYIKRSKKSLAVNGQVVAITPKTQVKLVAVGKAAWAMAVEAEVILEGLISQGICITKYKHAGKLKYCEIVEAAHPVPDNNSVLAATKIKNLLGHVNEHTIVIVLLSGGASSLMVDLPSGISLSNLQTTFEALVNSGLSIHEINTVRKHLSELKGGGLAKLAQPAKLFSLIISDVVGDDIDIIASGPTVPDTSTFKDAYQVVEKAGLVQTLPKPIIQYLRDGKNGLIAETPKAKDSCFTHSHTAIIGSNRIALRQASKMAAQLGYHPILLRKSIQSSSQKAVDYLLKKLKASTLQQPICLIAGGETTVAMPMGSSPKKGGRNIHTVLQAIAVHASYNLPYEVLFFSGATDGTDGTSGTAGAMSFLQDAKHHLSTVSKYLNEFKSYHYFKKMGGLYHCKATQTNVMDIFILIAIPLKK